MTDQEFVDKHGISPAQAQQSRFRAGKVFEILSINPYQAAKLVDLANVIKTQVIHHPADKTRAEYVFLAGNAHIHLDHSKSGFHLSIPKEVFTDETKGKVFSLLADCYRASSRLEVTRQVIPCHYYHLKQYVDSNYKKYRELRKRPSQKNKKGSESSVARILNTEISHRKAIMHATANYLASYYSFFETISYYIYAFDAKAKYVPLKKLQGIPLEDRYVLYLPDIEYTMFRNGIRLRNFFLHGFVTRKGDGTYAMFEDLGVMPPRDSLSLFDLLLGDKSEYKEIVDKLHSVMSRIEADQNLFHSLSYAKSGLILVWNEENFNRYHEMSDLDPETFEQGNADEARLMDEYENYER